MDKLRRELADRYKNARQEDRPQVRICDDCKKNIYDSKVCMVTGRLHEPKKTTLIGGQRVDGDKRMFTGKELMSAIDAIRIRWAPAKLQNVKVDVDSVNIFQTFLLQRQWKMQRYGILYGTFDLKNETVTVHACYEPEQIGEESSFTVVPDEREEKVNKLAELLGWRRVGVIASHPPRDPDEIVLSGKELMLLAREQSRYGRHCVLLTVAPNLETGQINLQAWQASEQCINLFQLGFLNEDAENPGYVHSKEPLEVAQSETDAKGHSKLITKEPSKSVDCRWMTGFVAVETYNSDIGQRFIRISRPGEQPPNFSNLKTYFNDPKRKDKKFVEKVSDFHVLVFLMETFDIKNDMPVFVEAIRTKENARLANYEEFINAAMASM